MSGTLNLSQAVKEILLKAGSSVELRRIYDGIEETFPLSASQQELTRYNEPRFHHEIRAILNNLVQNGEAIIVSRGLYRKT